MLACIGPLRITVVTNLAGIIVQDERLFFCTSLTVLDRVCLDIVACWTEPMKAVPGFTVWTFCIPA